MLPAAAHRAPPERAAPVERRNADRYRVTVHMDGAAWFYRAFRSNVEAMDYQRQMRDIYRRAGLHVWVRKERL
ncbi:hypothetical protein EOA32_00760 [Mesorhizobium sp. M1A.F.Ca.ET.072.01.1.1]|nr:hypothetical protein EOA32_00760 [Mesorhizobium sp. M1A.F.Ca.ET.072.01.1.1]